MRNPTIDATPHNSAPKKIVIFSMKVPHPEKAESAPIKVAIAMIIEETKKIMWAIFGK